MVEGQAGFMPPWRRPIRIPDSVSVGHSEPPFAPAGERGTWRMPLELARDVAAGAILKLQLAGGRNNRPYFADDQSDQPDADGYVAVLAPAGEALPLTKDEGRGTYTVAVPGEGLKAGAMLTLVLGDRSGGGGGVRMPDMRALNKFVVLYVAASAYDHPQQWSGQTQDQIVAACSMHILGGPTEHLRAYAPSQVRPGEQFSILVRPEDRFSNLSHEFLDGAQVLLDGRPLDSRTERVPGSTCVRVYTTLPQEGVYRLTLVGAPGGAEGVTNPIVCTAAETTYRPYWGMMHGHTEMSDGRESLDDYFHQMRHEAAIDFAATSDHDSLTETPDSYWEAACRAVKSWHEPGTFVVFLGYEWAKWRKNGTGDRIVYYLHDDRPMYRSDDGNYPMPADLFPMLADEDAMVVPHHTGHGGNFCDWTGHDVGKERLVEIFQALGCFECSEADGNGLPCRSQIPDFEPGYVRNGLVAGWRVGFTGGGDDHGGHAGTEFPSLVDGVVRTKGNMYVLASGRTREEIWDALRQRRTVATSGPRVLLDYTLSCHALGSELRVGEEPGLASLREVTVRCHGMAPLARIDVIRNGGTAYSYDPQGALDCEFTWEDREPAESLWLPPTVHCPEPFCFYYVRMLQQDGQMAWASPVWISP